ncbi:ATP dependent DNA ligase domain protein [Talaromyces stipitatus ATCC 10500]|uniref:ATP dependent DNA ligase domain protein n=1 Tax=Talaromyces stipitatus (strain ATCC 10500 / CBS 375.48 / QM 6759 / NRRL 1006) TaxID=441959 RepID=B8MAT7_TALSN|nr:ATP dependent DNA ligase domain protein [Talaromyces stipitatus ATCC 10500]EED17777.1 ATP dependent DNA ligase domain protein [Talaromyces stipitatus ATCC 10500]
MGFKFSYVCDLLSGLERNRHLKATSTARAQNPDFRIISSWFLNYSKRLYDKDTDLLAVLSCLLPEKRPDRVYFLQHASLARIIGRCLYLGASRLKDLGRWQVSGGGDLGECVENVMSQAENQIPPGQEVTVEEIDNALQEIASCCRFSGPSVRRKHAAVDFDEVLGSLYRRLSSRDAKWLTRMILKSYHPVQIPVDYFLKKVHFLLPHLLLFQNSLEAAVELLKSPSLKLFPPQPQSDFANLLSDKALEHLVPRLGIKIGRPEYYKARSIKHCSNMIRQRRMSLERKYDGEYCQIHIDISKGQDCIQIFSKSGKDSTLDRAGIHDVIKRSLAIGDTNCKVSRRCILEGELLVWDDRDCQIMEFHKLRKFLSRSGVYIGADLDSQPKPYEHLMIVFFDILLLDDDICLSKPHRLRRLLLKETVRIAPGRAEISEQEIIDFSRPDAIRRLQLALSRSITERWEGYVIKACDEPYFSILSPEKSDSFSRWIKLKKDYIPGLGDTADFALIGARYDAKDAPLLSKVRQLSWTHFFIGCLDNKEDVVRQTSSPRFRIVDMIGTHSLNENDMQVLNQWGKFAACDVDSNTAFDCYSIQNSLPKMDVAFKTPFVVELLGSGFDKAGNAQYYTLRFPRVLKIHWDRSFKDTVSFTELQDLAEKARAVPTEELQEENALWFEKVVSTDKKNEYIVDKSQSTTTSSFTCTSSLSKSASLISPDLTPPSVKQTPASLIRANKQNPSKAFSQSPSVSSLNKHERTLSLIHPLSKLNSTSTLHAASSDLHSASSDLHSALSTLYSASCSKRPKISASTSSSTMENSIHLDQAPQQSLRARGSPIPRALTTSIGSISANPTSQLPHTPRLASGFTTPLRENPNLAECPNPKRAVATYKEAWKFIADAADVAKKNEDENYDIGDYHLNKKDSRHLQVPLKSPLSTIPIYCGEFGFQEDMFRQAPREFTFSAKHFVKSLGFPHTREALQWSNPAAAEFGIAMGIVLVNIKDPSRVLAMQLYNLGNLVTSELSQPNTELPSQGKIFFLDSRILKAGGHEGINNDIFLLNDWWTEYGTQYFYATVSWRQDRSTAPSNSGPRRVIDQINKFGARALHFGEPAAAKIINLYEPSDVEVLGEFVSVRPNVHLFGDRYKDPNVRTAEDDKFHYPLDIPDPNGGLGIRYPQQQPFFV